MLRFVSTPQPIKFTVSKNGYFAVSFLLVLRVHPCRLAVRRGRPVQGETRLASGMDFTSIVHYLWIFIITASINRQYTWRSMTHSLIDWFSKYAVRSSPFHKFICRAHSVRQPASLMPGWSWTNPRRRLIPVIELLKVTISPLCEENAKLPSPFYLYSMFKITIEPKSKNQRRTSNTSLFFWPSHFSSPIPSSFRPSVEWAKKNSEIRYPLQTWKTRTVSSSDGERIVDDTRIERHRGQNRRETLSSLNSQFSLAAEKSAFVGHSSGWFLSFCNVLFLWWKGGKMKRRVHWSLKKKNTFQYSHLQTFLIQRAPGRSAVPDLSGYLRGTLL